MQAPAEARGPVQDGAGHRPEPLEAEQRGGQADVALRGGAGQRADHGRGPRCWPGHGEPLIVIVCVRRGKKDISVLMLTHSRCSSGCILHHDFNNQHTCYPTVSGIVIYDTVV